VADQQKSGTYTVSLKSLFTDSEITITSIRAKSPNEAQDFALGSLTNPEVWAVNFVAKHGIEK
jgi:hypothetical protein